MRHALVAQLDRVTGYEPVGRGFESLPARHVVADFISFATTFLFPGQSRLSLIPSLLLSPKSFACANLSGGPMKTQHRFCVHLFFEKDSNTSILVGTSFISLVPAFVFFGSSRKCAHCAVPPLPKSFACANLLGAHHAKHAGFWEDRPGDGSIPSTGPSSAPRRRGLYIVRDDFFISRTKSSLTHTVAPPFPKKLCMRKPFRGPHENAT